MAIEGMSEVILPDGTIMRFTKTTVVLDQDEIGYVVMDTIAGGSIDICYMGDCAIYVPPYGWLFENPTCYSVGKIYSYLKRVLKTPNPIVNRLVRKAFDELVKIMEHCSGSRKKNRR